MAYNKESNSQSKAQNSDALLAHEKSHYQKGIVYLTKETVEKIRQYKENAGNNTNENTNSNISEKTKCNVSKNAKTAEIAAKDKNKTSAKNAISAEIPDDEVSLDFGLTFAKIKDCDLSKIPLDEVKGDFLYAWNGRDLFKLAVFDKNYYRLRIISRAPILEIDGLRMQLVRDFATPLDYSKGIAEKMELGKNDLTLDTCMGLGYTAIAAHEAGSGVETCEISRAVYELARWNPYSARLFSGANIRIYRQDAIVHAIASKPGKFSAIIHDPPRFTLAPNLYSFDFYQSLYRIAADGCRMFHYTGSLGEKSGKRDIQKEVEKRLEDSGWEIIENSRLYQGMFCEKVWKRRDVKPGI